MTVLPSKPSPIESTPAGRLPSVAGAPGAVLGATGAVAGVLGPSVIKPHSYFFLTFFGSLAPLGVSADHFFAILGFFIHIHARCALLLNGIEINSCW
jgi:hypothetical protein